MGKIANWKLVGTGALALLCLSACKSSKDASDGGGDMVDSGVVPLPKGAVPADGGYVINGTYVPVAAYGEPDLINPDCPEDVFPTGDGKYAPKGKCCYRTANSTRIAAQGDGDHDIAEYRLNYVQTTNHPKSIGLDILRGIGDSRSKNEEQSVLWRFEGPYKDGKQASGDGKITIGAGRYNCDGTYSYYSDKAAPARTFSQDPTRWAAPVVPVKIDVTKTKAAERTVPYWDTNVNRGFTLSPYLNSNDFTLDWELVNQGFTIEDMPSDNAALDCMGERAPSKWTKGGTFTVYTPLAANNTDHITAIGGQTYCQLVAFGVLDSKEITSDALSCDKAKRCKPGSKGCRWIKLPDSLCPATTADQANWGCHIGDENNVDNEPTKCTAKAPTGKLDPMKGATTEGQCCDPMGTSTTLPACNSYFLRNEFVAGAVQITDDLKDELQPDCTVAHAKK